MIINQALLKKDIHFPALKPIKTNRRKGFFGKLKDFATYRRKFKFLNDWAVYSKEIDKFIFIPKEFIVDGASVPKLLHFSYSSTGILLYGSFPHDFGYRYHGLFIIEDDQIIFKKFKRGKLDDIFLEICSQENNMPTVSKIAKTALTLFGNPSWNKNKNNIIDEDYPEYFL